MSQRLIALPIAMLLAVGISPGCDDDPVDGSGDADGDSGEGADGDADGDGDGDGDSDGDADGDADLPSEIGPAHRPATLLPPEALSPEAAPLAVLLHGYGPGEESYAFLVALGEWLRGEGFFVVIPDGSRDSDGYQFWNAGALCCDWDGSGVDDVAYLRGLILEATAGAPIDPDKVTLFGHSNGGFMVYRMACEASDLLASVVSLAGTGSSTEEVCTPARPVSVLHLHGDADDIVPFGGGPLSRGGVALGAEETVRRWAGAGGCDLDAESAGGEHDYEANLPGPETEASAFTETCRDGCRFELWRIRGGGHRPELTNDFFVDLAHWMHARAGDS